MIYQDAEVKQMLKSLGVFLNKIDQRIDELEDKILRNIYLRSYTINEVCDILNKSESTVRKLVKSGKLHSVIRNSTIYIPHTSLKKFLYGNTSKTKKEISLYGESEENEIPNQDT